jgi:general secretion pathway protein K
VPRVSLNAILRRNERGSAMLMATLVAGLLAAAAAGMLMQSRTARAASGETLRLERARLEADALLSKALVRLDAGEALPARGLLFATANGGRVLRQDAPGLLDINAAEPVSIAALLVALDVDSEDATDIADRIADWRDDDNLTRPHGAERQAYEGSGFAPPANRPFEVETEISSVLGISEALARCVAPYLTTYSGSEGVDPSAAPDVLRTIFAVGDNAPIQTATPPFGRVVILSAEAPISRAAVLRVRIWTRFTGDANHPFVTHRAAEDLAPRRADEGVASCAEDGAP